MILQLATGGLLLGCIYGLVAMGLSLIYGVMGIVNFAHGAFVMLAMYASYWLYSLAGLDPVIGTPLVALLMFGFGIVVYRLIIGKVLRGPFLARLLSRSEWAFLRQSGLVPVDSGLSYGSGVHFPRIIMLADLH